MERLTKRIDENRACFAICEKECPDGIYADNPACMCTAGIAALKKLMEYEDMEEQGKLLILPCKSGDTVYVKMQYGGYKIGEVRDFSHFISCGFCAVVTSDYFEKQHIPFTEFGKTVFLTEQEAKEALEGMKK